MKYIILVLRGHIRDSFDDNLLAFFVKTLCSIYNVKIYIHTWKVYSTNLSWRNNVEVNNNEVLEEDILDYFEGVKENIVSITIEDDKKIELIGNLEGKLFSSGIPALAWKRMWYGIYKTVEKIELNESIDDVIINTRFDLFNNSYPINYSKILLFIKDNLGRKMNQNFFYAAQYGLTGSDNFYMGNHNTMKLLASEFYYNLDELNKAYIDVISQEHTVIYENNRLFLFKKKLVSFLNDESI